MALWVKLVCSFDVQEYIVVLFVALLPSFSIGWASWLWFVSYQRSLLDSVPCRALVWAWSNGSPWCVIMNSITHRRWTTIFSRRVSDLRRMIPHKTSSLLLFYLPASFFSFAAWFPMLQWRIVSINKDKQQMSLHGTEERVAFSSLLSHHLILERRRRRSRRNEIQSQNFSHLFSLFLCQYLTCRSRFGCLLENKWRSTILHPTSPESSNMIRSLLDDRERERETYRKQTRTLSIYTTNMETR